VREQRPLINVAVLAAGSTDHFISRLGVRRGERLYNDSIAGFVENFAL